MTDPPRLPADVADPPLTGAVAQDDGAILGLLRPADLDGPVQFAPAG